MNKTNQILIAVWLVVASFIAYLTTGLLASRQSVEHRVRDQAMSYARLVEQHASASFDRVNVGLIGVMDHIRPGDLIGAKHLDHARRAEIDALLLTQQQRTPGVIAMPLANANGDIIAHSLGAPPGANLSDRDHFLTLKQQVRTEVAMSAVAYGRVSNKSGVLIGRRIDLPDGTFGGMVGANLGLAENFTDFYSTLALGKDSAVSLRDDKNTLLVRYPIIAEKLGKQIAAAGVINERILAGDAEGIVVVASAMDDIERAFAFRRLAHYPIYAAVGLSLEDALCGWRLERNRVALGAMLILVAGILITIMLRRKERAEDLLHTLAVIVESSGASITAADLNGVVTSWNAGAQKLYGYSAEEMIGKSALVLVPSEKREEYQALVERSAIGEGIENLESVRVARDGRRIDVSLTVSPIRDRGGRPVGYSVIARDITERKHAEASLLEAQKLLEEVEHLSKLGGWKYDCATRVMTWTNELYRIYGVGKDYDPGNVKRDTGFYSPEDAATISTAFSKAVTDGEPYDLELRFVRRNGERIWIRTTGTPQVRDGKVVNVTGNIIDITERKTAEEELKKSIAFRDLLSEAMPLPVYYKDASRRYTGCNSAFARFIGKAKSEVPGKMWFDLSPQSPAKSQSDRDIDLLSGPHESQTYETRVAHADGTLHDVILHKARITDDAGKSTGIVGVITDITELKQIQAKHDLLEAQLRQSQKMEALGTLAGGVAHDFNNIIAAIMGNVELARQDVGAEHAALESLEEIRKASARAKILVQQILAFSRRQKASREVISLAPVVEESLRLLRTTLPAGVSLTVICAPDAPAVLADATQVEQVLLNLCGNAWQATQSQARPGLIEVRLQAHERLEAPAQAPGPALAVGDEVRPGRYACLTVQDNGSGMDEETLARIFEPFFTTKPVDKGTGLGLAVVHGIVQEHGASIEVHSVPGEGSVFCVYFPAAQASEQDFRTRTAKVAPMHGQGKHVLYVDDDESIVFLMCRLLERQGYRVSGYTDPNEALAAVRAEPDEFDLAVTDYNMPSMSGLEVARALREIRADLPVAMATGYITDELREEAPAAGVNELIYKPNTVDELCAAVARLAAARIASGNSS